MKEFIKKFIPSFLLSWYHFLLSFLAVVVYRFPSFSKKIKVIGVTGTSGKSTVVEMTSRILEKASYKVAFLSSIKFKIKDKEWPNDLRMTMPGRLRLQRFLRRALSANCQYVVLEVTSEGIKQHRHRFIDFEVAVLTNLTPEHIEAHGSFEKYREAKEKLFQATKNIHILNLDDENIKYFSEFPANEKYGYTIKNPEPSVLASKSQTIIAKDSKMSDKGMEFFVNNTKFSLKLLGEFNIYNALAAISIARSQNIPLGTCKTALEKIEGIPGRMEMVISNPFKVFVDYALTPNALEKVYQTIRDSLNPSKIICVLGSSGGGRDKWKRAVLGKLAAKYCQEIIVTNEDPHDEDPMEIINQIAKGVGEKARKILDRREAIRESLKRAQTGDVVVITGKGCESCIWVTKGKKIPWDDRRVVREEFQKLWKKNIKF
jgi:UDP-N-acetylmuramoyl-L-alanyl-D-glutamate--2,6-diaminopimelate ligase